MDEQAYYRVSIKGIAVDEDGRILLAREADGRWEMLGGGLEHGEDPIAGLKREIYEETGLDVTYVSPNPLYFVTSKRRHADTYMANVIYRIELTSLAFVPSDECQELRFFSTADMRQVDLFPNVEKLLEILERHPA